MKYIICTVFAVSCLFLTSCASNQKQTEYYLNSSQDYNYYEQMEQLQRNDNYVPWWKK